MKIQLKRSNVLESGSAKRPTPSQMEYGELAVNYNSTDPTIFIKDSSNVIVPFRDTTKDIIRLDGEVARLDGEVSRLDGEITDIKADIVTIQSDLGSIDVRVTSIESIIPTPISNLTPQPGTLDDRYLLKTEGEDAANNGQININSGTGLVATGDNATANQSIDTTRIISLDTAYTDNRYVNTTGDVITGDLTISGAGTLTLNNGLQIGDLAGNGEDIVGVDNAGVVKSFSIAALPERTTIVEDDWVLLQASNGTKYKQSVSNFAGTMKSIQKGSTAFSGSAVTVTLAQPVNESKSYILISVAGKTNFQSFGTNSSGGGAGGAATGTASAKISSDGRSVIIQPGSSWNAGGPFNSNSLSEGTAEWQVVEFY